MIVLGNVAEASNSGVLFFFKVRCVSGKSSVNPKIFSSALHNRMILRLASTSKLGKKKKTQRGGTTHHKFQVPNCDVRNSSKVVLGGGMPIEGTNCLLDRWFIPALGCVFKHPLQIYLPGEMTPFGEYIFQTGGSTHHLVQLIGTLFIPMCNTIGCTILRPLTSLPNPPREVVHYIK